MAKMVNSVLPVLYQNMTETIRYLVPIIFSKNWVHLRCGYSFTLIQTVPWSWWRKNISLATSLHQHVSLSPLICEGLGLDDLSNLENCGVLHFPSTYGQGVTNSYYLCLFSAILRISQVLVNLSDSSRVKPHSCSSDQARSGPMALANSSATFSTLIGEGPSLKFPFADFWGTGFVFLFCTRWRRSFHSSAVSGIQPAQRNTEMLALTALGTLPAYRRQSKQFVKTFPSKTY